MEPIKLRPHHLIRSVDIYQRYDEGKDGGHQFRESYESKDTSNYGQKFHKLHHTLIRAIIDNPDISILLTDTWDDLCDVCDRRNSCDYVLESGQDVERVTKLGFTIGQQITSRELLERMQRRKELMSCVFDEISSKSPLGKYLLSIAHTLF